VVCHTGLAERARVGAPNTVIVPFQLFVGDPVVATVVAAVKRGELLRGIRTPV
jgi:hypothetical protein